jgi:hypothetical protein
MGMQRARAWWLLQHALFVAFLLSVALNMLRVRAGFFTNYAADLLCPAGLYVVGRGLGAPARDNWMRRTFGRTPELMALSLFFGSALTEVSQRYWPHGIFPGRFDPLDLVAYAVGLGACYAGERRFSI